MFTIFYGALVSPKSLTVHTASPNAVLCVSKSSGNVEWIEHDVHASSLQSTLVKHGLQLEDVEVVELKHGEFLMPGFIDTHIVSSSCYAFHGTPPETYFA